MSNKKVMEQKIIEIAQGLYLGNRDIHLKISSRVF